MSVRDLPAFPTVEDALKALIAALDRVDAARGANDAHVNAGPVMADYSEAVSKELVAALASLRLIRRVAAARL